MRGTLDNVDQLEEEENRKSGEKPEEEKEKKTQAQILVRLASNMVLFYDEQENSYAKVKVNNHYEVWPIRSKGFRDILTYRYLNLSDDKDKAPGSQALQDALRALEAKARIEGQKREVHVRVAETEGSIFLDLCNDNWQVVEINKKGWKVIDEYPVYFKRSRIMQSLPIPEDGGSIDDLRPFINYESNDDYKLIIAWLLSTFKEKSPFPILTIQGEQGSAKSTTTKVLRALIDPSSLPLRALPNEERDLSIAANNTWVLAFDNLSGLSNQMSDGLCKVSTGGGLATRKLYSDDEEAVFNIMRPTILNGIDDIAKRQDLLDRSIVLNLPSIEEDNRKDEKTFWREFYHAKGSILGALCTVISEALKELPNTKLKSKPRMADFALWVTAAEKALNWKDGEFTQIYIGNRDQAIDQGLDSDPVAVAVRLFMENRTEWENTPQMTLEALEKLLKDERIKNSRAWTTSNKLRQRLRRIAPALRSKGIEFIELPRTNKGRLLRLEKMPKKATQPTQPTQANSIKGLEHDGTMTVNSDHDGSTDMGDTKGNQPTWPKASRIKGYDGSDGYDGKKVGNSNNEDLII